MGSPRRPSRASVAERRAADRHHQRRNRAARLARRPPRGVRVDRRRRGRRGRSLAAPAERPRRRDARSGATRPDPTPLIRERGAESSPAWAPDGARLAYARDAGRRRIDPDRRRRGARGRRRPRRRRAGAADSSCRDTPGQVAWSPDGRTLLVTDLAERDPGYNGQPRRGGDTGGPTFPAPTDLGARFLDAPVLPDTTSRPLRAVVPTSPARRLATFDAVWAALVGRAHPDAASAAGLAGAARPSPAARRRGRRRRGARGRHRRADRRGAADRAGDHQPRRDRRLGPSARVRGRRPRPARRRQRHRRRHRRVVRARRGRARRLGHRRRRDGAGVARRIAGADRRRLQGSGASRGVARQSGGPARRAARRSRPGRPQHPRRRRRHGSPAQPLRQRPRRLGRPDRAGDRLRRRAASCSTARCPRRSPKARPRPAATPARGRCSCPAGRLPQPGDRFVNADLAATLRVIAAQGAGAFYRGDLARRMVDDLASHGGILTREDLEQYRVVERAPVRGAFRGHVVFSTPPPVASGTALIEVLQTLDRQPAVAGAQLARDVDVAHLLIETFRHVHYVRAVDPGDVARSERRASRARARRRRLRPDRSAPGLDAPARPPTRTAPRRRAAEAAPPPWRRVPTRPRASGHASAAARRRWSPPIATATWWWSPRR